MSYKILEANVKFVDNKIERITVLVLISKGDVRTIAADTKDRGPYEQIMPDERLNEQLLQNIAGRGFQTDDYKLFPGWKSRYKHII